jgi:uncharacterized membrane protein YeaQ/YmgE (transglycosylase-associated protein family)
VVILIWVALGAFLGWLASTIMRTLDRQARFLSIVVGMAGALFGGALFRGVGNVWAMNLDAFSVSALLVAVLSATILLVLARLARLTG